MLENHKLDLWAHTPSSYFTEKSHKIPWFWASRLDYINSRTKVGASIYVYVEALARGCGIIELLQGDRERSCRINWHTTVSYNCILSRGGEFCKQTFCRKIFLFGLDLILAHFHEFFAWQNKILTLEKTNDQTEDQRDFQVFQTVTLLTLYILYVEFYGFFPFIL